MNGSVCVPLGGRCDAGCQDDEFEPNELEYEATLSVRLLSTYLTYVFVEVRLTVQTTSIPLNWRNRGRSP